MPAIFRPYAGLTPLCTLDATVLKMDSNFDTKKLHLKVAFIIKKLNLFRICLHLKLKTRTPFFNKTPYNLNCIPFSNKKACD